MGCGTSVAAASASVAPSKSNNLRTPSTVKDAGSQTSVTVLISSAPNARNEAHDARKERIAMHRAAALVRAQDLSNSRGGYTTSVYTESGGLSTPRSGYSRTRKIKSGGSDVGSVSGSDSGCTLTRNSAGRKSQVSARNNQYAALASSYNNKRKKSRSAPRNSSVINPTSPVASTDSLTKQADTGYDGSVSSGPSSTFLLNSSKPNQPQRLSTVVSEEGGCSERVRVPLPEPIETNSRSSTEQDLSAGSKVFPAAAEENVPATTSIQPDSSLVVASEKTVHVTHESDIKENTPQNYPELTIPAIPAAVVVEPETTDKELGKSSSVEMVSALEEAAGVGEPSMETTDKVDEQSVKKSDTGEGENGYSEGNGPEKESENDDKMNNSIISVGEFSENKVDKLLDGNKIVTNDKPMTNDNLISMVEVA